MDNWINLSTNNSNPMPNLPAASSLSHSKVTFKDSFILKAKQTLIYHTSLEHLTLS